MIHSYQPPSSPLLTVPAPDVPVSPSVSSTFGSTLGSTLGSSFRASPQHALAASPSTIIAAKRRPAPPESDNPFAVPKGDSIFMHQERDRLRQIEVCRQFACVALFRVECLLTYLSGLLPTVAWSMCQEKRRYEEADLWERTKMQTSHPTKYEPSWKRAPLIIVHHHSIDICMFHTLSLQNQTNGH